MRGSDMATGAEKDTATDPADGAASTKSYVTRIHGLQHLVHYVKDDQGREVPVLTGPLKVEFRPQDLAQLVAGACVMALPVAVTEEVWDMGESLSFIHTLLILTASLLALAGFVWSLFYVKQMAENTGDFFRRVVSAYAVTFIVSFTLLFLFDKAPLYDLGVAFTRTVRVAFPASFAATAVDFLK